MPLSTDERLGLLRTASYARNSSNASADTIGNSGLVAFLQVGDTLRTIGSRAATVSAIDVLMPLLISMFMDNVGLPLVQAGAGRLMSRVVNSRVVVGKFVSAIPGVKMTTTTQLYAGVQRRFNFTTYSDVLEAHRLEQAVLSNGEQGIGALVSAVVPGRVDAILKGGASGSTKPPGASSTVSIVDSALSYAAYQRLITNNIFDELEDRVRLDVTNDLPYYDTLVGELTALYVPLKVGGAEVALDQLRNSFTLFFEELVWSGVFFGDNPYKELKITGTTNTPRINYFGDVGKDVALTRYLLKRFARGRDFYSEKSSKDFHIDSETRLMAERFRKLAKTLKTREAGFGRGASILDVR